MWTQSNRLRHNRDHLRYPSDLTEAEWELVEPLIPAAKRGGRKREVNLHEVVDGVMYLLSTGCRWRAWPKDRPPRSTVFGYLAGGYTTARWIASIRRGTRSAASGRAATLSPAPA
jgi:transposase